MDMSIATPSLLFPAISLLLLAYTNRFVTLTNVIRQLARSDDVSEELVRRQVKSFRVRLQVIRSMQVFGVSSFVLCTVSMFALYLGWVLAGQLLFGASLLLLLVSLLCSLYEVHISTKAINMEIEHMFEASGRKSSDLPRRSGEAEAEQDSPPVV